MPRKAKINTADQSNFPNLKQYLERKNAMKSLFNQPLIEFPVDEATAKPIIEMLECDISPENISCDGERPRNEVNYLYNLYTNATTELGRILGRKIVLEY